jgi:hypothetical protein
MIKKTNKSAYASITGIILPVKWNEQGKAARISIQTDNKKEYRVNVSGAGKELLNYTYKKVQIEGKPKEQLSGGLTVDVRRYKIIEEQPETGGEPHDAF